LQLKRLSAAKPNFTELSELVSALKEMLANGPKAELTVEELLAFQDVDGSFRLLDSYEVPSDVRADFCYLPTCIGTAILLKEYLNGKSYLISALAKALEACLSCDFLGQGYEAEQEAEKARILALQILSQGGLREFLETEREICPEFHNKVHNIVHRFNSCLQRGTGNPKECRPEIWPEDFSTAWREIAAKLKLSKRLYLAYGSNMNKTQMAKRCPGAKVLGKTYLENWALTLPHYANIERSEGKKTPAVVWEITSKNEKALDRYEGYPYAYDKLNMIVNVDGKRMSAMAYVMTAEYKNYAEKPYSGYLAQILQGYRDAGFTEAEFQPAGTHKVDV